jgi:ribulose-5-phosphate 4-epimerase/fuculose-1-phosphate aldolase
LSKIENMRQTLEDQVGMLELREIRRVVALSCRILAMEGLVEGILGHVSARVPGSSEMLIRCRGEEEHGIFFTREPDIRRVDFDGQGPDLGDSYEVPKEFPIHGEIYKARPEVGCVIHAHPPAALVCGIADLKFRPVFGAFNIPAMRMALEGIPVFPRSLLITRPELAALMMDSMGTKDICLMKGHGITVTGGTVEEATVRALNFNVLARVTLQVALTGKQVADIPQEDVAELPDLGSTFNDKWVFRYHAKMIEEGKTTPDYWR